MKNIVTGTDMKKVDSYTINTIGIPSLVLMERAALSVAEIVCKNQLKDKKILVVAGVGNNGADGVAICRILHLKGYNTELYILGDISKASTEFKQQLSIAHNIGINIVGDYNDADVIIDSIFGVGLSRNVEGVYKDVILKINKGRNFVYSVDIPSGVSADTGKICGVAVKANCTVTFGSYKIGTVLCPGAEYCGQVVVADIGFPQEAYEQIEEQVKTATLEDFNFIPPRPNYSNKGTYGKILIIAGSKDISGAAVLCAEAAFRVGAGLVRVFTAEQNRQIIQRLLPEAMVNTYDVHHFNMKSLEACLKWCNVVAIGPGIGTGVIQKNMIEKVLEYNLPTVIDADGINNISEDERLKKKLHKNVVITPHLGEMSRFLNIPVEEIASNLIKYGREVNYKYNINCILKDARTVITTEQETFVNLSGNSGMATAGSGDVLTGIVAALIGIGVEFNNATVLAPYIHGLAGDKAMEYVSKTSMMATDIIEGIKILFKGMR